MKFATRLWLGGALVPFLGTIGAVLVGGHLFRWSLEKSVDQALMGLAAVESVSLFDGPEEKPHLHVATSPLGDAVRRNAPAAALYDPQGIRILRQPEAEADLVTDERLHPDDVGEDATLATRTIRDVRYRVLSVEVKNPWGGPHALQLAASLAGVDATVGEYYRTGISMALGLGALLVLLQTFLAHQVTRRVGALTGHMAALREGNLDAIPPPPDGNDELAVLARVVADATGKLHEARAAQDRLVADAAHELRTPLTLMRTSIDLALRRRREVPELVASLEETRREVDRLARLATRLLDLATAGRAAWDRQPGDVAHVADEAAEAARGEAEKKSVLVQVDAPRRPVEASFDPNGLRQALDNLLANAVKFSPPGQAVTVKVGRVDGVVRIAVVDRGQGIKPEDRERIFEPFERGQKGPGGAGLGLAIVREIARGHGGRAFAADARDGAEVVLELPAQVRA